MKTTGHQSQKSCIVGMLLVLIATVQVSCGTTKTPDTPTPEVGHDQTPAEEARDHNQDPLAPWQAQELDAGAVPTVYLDQWRQAENRSSCALIAPVSLGVREAASIRSAYFGGGWGIAYDLPHLRSAFGIAGTGAAAAGSSYDEWPYKKEWPDGSSVGYGPEGGSGPNQLAYLRIPGQDCLYNVWSRLGIDHLETLLEHLRFVDTGG